MGVPIAEISNSLAVMFGSSYVGDFMHDSQVRRIMVQADGKSRLNGNDIEDLHVRNDQGLSLIHICSWQRSISSKMRVMRMLNSGVCCFPA